MRYAEIIERDETKSGEPISFEVVKDFEGDKNRGWRVDKINAFVDGQQAGYIKLSYIPRERFVRHYPTIFHFLAKIKGMGEMIIGSSWTDIRHYREYSDDELRKFVKNARFRLLRDESLNVNELDRDDLLKQALALEQRANEEYGEMFQKFETFHVDKPLVDYIRVFSQGEYVNRDSNERSRRDFQRQRVGEALYLKGAEYLKAQGLRLHASDTQSPQAKAAWQMLEREHTVKTDPDGRRYLEV